MRSNDRYDNYVRQNHVNYVVGMLIAEIPPEIFVDEVRRVYLEVGLLLEVHIRNAQTAETG